MGEGRRVKSEKRREQSAKGENKNEGRRAMGEGIREKRGKGFSMGKGRIAKREARRAEGKSYAMKSFL